MKKIEKVSAGEMAGICVISYIIGALMWGIWAWSEGALPLLPVVIMSALWFWFVYVFYKSMLMTRSMEDREGQSIHESQ